MLFFQLWWGVFSVNKLSDPHGSQRFSAGRRVEEETAKEQQGASQLEELRWDDFWTLSPIIMFQWKITP